MLLHLYELYYLPSIKNFNGNFLINNEIMYSSKDFPLTFFQVIIRWTSIQ